MHADDENNEEYLQTILEDVDEMLATMRFKEVIDKTDNEIYDSVFETICLICRGDFGQF